MTFKLTEKQEEATGLISGDATHILLYGGSRSAKTFLAVLAIVTRAWMAAYSRHLIARFRFNHVKNSIIYDTFPKVMEVCFPGVGYDLSKSDWFATLPNGSEIWFGGLDDKERTEKVLGNEYCTIFLNECSQLSWPTRNTIVTRLAQRAFYQKEGEEHEMRLKMLYDENPPPKGHWTYQLFIEKRNPENKMGLKNPDNFASLLMNPNDNRDNLSPTYLEELDNLPKLKRDRFYLGLFADMTQNALWSVKVLEKSRVSGIPEDVNVIRTVIAVDPSGSTGDPETSNDDIGIVVVSLGSDGIAYVVEDLTGCYGPRHWAQIVNEAFQRHDADRVVAEVNYGGAMVEHVIKSENKYIPYKEVRASRGKVIRAEPVSALHESGKIKLVGDFHDMEDELLATTTSGYTGDKSPNRLDAFVWAITELFPKIAGNKGQKLATPFVLEMAPFEY